MLTSPLSRPLVGPLATALTAARVGGGAAPTLASLLSEAGTADWDISVAASLKQNSDGTTAVANGDPIGYIADQTGHGLPLTQATAGKRGILSSRSGVPMVQFDLSNTTDDELTLPVGIANTTGTLAWASQTSTQCITLDALDVLPPTLQFSRMCWFPRLLTTEERNVVLAALGGVFATNYDFESITTTWGVSAFGAGADLGVPGSNVAFTSELDGLFFTAPADFDYGTTYYGTDYRGTATLTAGRQWITVDVATPATLERIQFGYAYPANVYNGLGPVHDLATVAPNIESYQALLSGIEGGLDHVQIPASCTVFTATADTWRTGVIGRVPDLSGTNIVQFSARGARFSGLAPGFAFPASCNYVFLHSGKMPVATVNALLVAMDATGTINGQFYSDGSQMPAPTGAGAAAKTSLQGKGWAVTTP